MARKAKEVTSTPKVKATVILEKSAGAVVFFRGEVLEYLLVRSKDWEFPKGLVDGNESEEEAARREVREETGLDVALIGNFRETIGYFYRRKNGGGLVKKVVVYFLGEAKSQDYKISWEHEEGRWVNFEAAMELLDYENARAILTKANDAAKAGAA